MVSLRLLKQSEEWDRQVVVFTRCFENDEDLDRIQLAKATGDASDKRRKLDTKTPQPRSVVSDDALLESIAHSTEEQRRKYADLSKYGPLAANDPTRSKYASDEVVRVGILLMANHSEVRDLGFSTQLRSTLVDSQCVKACVHEFRQKGCPTSGFVLPTMSGLNGLAALQEKLREAGCPDLSRWPGLDNVSFVIHHDTHWSLLAYHREKNELSFYDSYNNAHLNEARQLRAMLLSIGLVPHTCIFNAPVVPAVQTGMWQCGYAVIVMAAFIGGALAPENGTPHEIISNGDALARFLGELLERSRANRQLKIYNARISRFYHEE